MWSLILRVVRVIGIGLPHHQSRYAEVCGLVINLNQELQQADRYWKEAEFPLRNSEINFAFKNPKGAPSLWWLVPRGTVELPALTLTAKQVHSF